MAGNHTEMTQAKRGFKIRTDFARDRSDEMPTNMNEARNGRLKGDIGNIDPMIKNGKVPNE